MIYRENEPLKKYTTIKLGGVAENFYIPQSKEELVELTGQLKDQRFYVLSGGSNLLITDEHPLKHVIYMKDVCQEICVEDSGVVICGASVRIQKLINTAKEKGLGGIEYLYSLPAMVGGIVCMNAGRGRDSQASICDHVVEVYTVKDGKEYTFSQDECQFGYRESVFQHNDHIITGVRLRLDAIGEPAVDAKIQERLDLCKRIQDHSGTTCGSVFMDYDVRIMAVLQKFFSRRKGVHWSPMRGNWLINDGTGTYKQAKKAIDFCKKMHRLTGKKAREEVVIWE